MKTQQIRDVKLSIGAQVHQQNIFETQTGIIAIGFLDSLSTIGCRGLDPVHLTQPTFALQGGGGPIIAARNHRDCLHACIAQSLYDAMQHWFTQYVEECVGHTHPLSADGSATSFCCGVGFLRGRADHQDGS